MTPKNSTAYTIGAYNACAKDTIWNNVAVLVNAPLTMNLNATDTTLCKGTNYSLKAAGAGGNSVGYSFSLFKSGVLMQSDTTGAFTFLVDTTANYFVVFTDGCSPNDTARLTISIYAPLKLKPIKDTTLCQPANITINAQGIGGNSASYSFSLYKAGVFLQSNTTGIFNFFVDSTANYSVIIQDACGIKDTMNFKVIMSDALKVKLNVTDTAICKGAVLNVKATGTGGNGNYTYSLFSSTQQLISTNTTGNFTITGDTDRIFIIKLKDNCSTKNDSALIHIKVNSTTVNDAVNILYTTVTGSINTYTIWNKLQDAVSYTIRNKTVTDTFFVDNNSQPSIQSEKYYVTANDKCGNKSALSLVAQTIYLKGENENFNEYALLQYTPYETWKNGVLRYEIEYYDKVSQSWVKLNTTAGNVLTSNSKVIPDSSGVGISTSTICYRVKAIEQNGNQELSVSNEVCVPIYPVAFLPNAFSPNGDGLNDYYKPICAGLNAYVFEIYNRWGELVYSDTPESKGWDGTFRGKPAEVGAYVFRLSAAGYLKSSYTNDARLVEEHGTIFLVR